MIEVFVEEPLERLIVRGRGRLREWRLSYPGVTFRNKGLCDIRLALCYIQSLFPCDVSDNLYRIHG